MLRFLIISNGKTVGEDFARADVFVLNGFNDVVGTNLLLVLLTSVL